jgi:hypothetical protein
MVSVPTAGCTPTLTLLWWLHVSRCCSNPGGSTAPCWNAACMGVCMGVCVQWSWRLRAAGCEGLVLTPCPWRLCGDAAVNGLGPSDAGLGVARCWVMYAGRLLWPSARTTCDSLCMVQQAAWVCSTDSFFSTVGSCWIVGAEAGGCGGCAACMFPACTCVSCISCAQRRRCSCSC